MLRNIGDLNLSIKFSERATRIFDAVYGKKSRLTAASYQTLSTSYLLAGETKLALNAEKVAYNSFKDILGPNDKLTLQSSENLKILTQRAVSDARRAKELENSSAKRKVNNNNSHNNNNNNNNNKSSSTSTITDKPSTSSETTSASKGHLPIDELLKFIEGPIN